MKGLFELSSEDLVEVMKAHLEKLGPKKVESIIKDYISDKYGYTPAKVDVPKDFKRVVIHIDESLGKDVPDSQKAKRNIGFTRKWTGLYMEVGEIIDKLRKRRKNFVSYKDLRAELLEKKDKAGNKLFVKGGEEIPMSVVKQRLAQSQVDRQAIAQPNLKGIKVDRENQGLSF